MKGGGALATQNRGWICVQLAWPSVILHFLPPSLPLLPVSGGRSCVPSSAVMMQLFLLFWLQYLKFHRGFLHCKKHSSKIFKVS